MISDEKYKCNLKDLEYVCRINPIAGLITSRAILEAIVNELILTKQYLNDEEEIERERLGKKIELLGDKKCLRERELTLIKNILFKGNDAAHRLKGEEATAMATYRDLMEFYEYIVDGESKKINKQNGIKEVTEILHPSESITLEKNRGIIEKFDGKRIGYIRDVDTNLLHIFSLSDNEKAVPKMIKIGDYIQFNLEENTNKKKAKFRAFNIEHIAKVIKTGKNSNKNKYAFLQSGKREEDIYLSLKSIEEELGTVSKGQELVFSIKEGTNKNEAYDVRLA